MTDLQSSDFSPKPEPDMDLLFLRDEGIEMLALLKTIRSDPTRRMLRDLMRTIVAGQREAANDGKGHAG